MNIAVSRRDLGALEDFHDFEHALEDFRTAVLEGLAKPQKAVSSKFFYDERGSKLFDRICELPEYYPTRTEVALLTRYSDEIAECVGAAPTVVEFGAGSVVKIRVLLDAVEAPVFVPLDISRDHLVQSSRQLAADYADTRVIAICADFTRDLELPQNLPNANRLGFFPGSTIGNFTRADARDFLVNARRTLGRGSAFLVGVDLRKDIDALYAAYNDAQGITAAFNMNLLRRVNRELGGTFDLAAFRHEAPWVEEEGRIEMRLISQKDQSVNAAGQRFRFRAGEYIHTEHSHKYDVDEFRDLARSAGYTPERVWVDDDRLFSLHYLKA